MEFTLLGAAAMGVGALYAMLWWEAKRGTAADCSRDLWDIALGAVVAGVVVGRLAAMIADGVNPLTSPSDILIVRGGVATGWAALTAICTVGWLARKELWPVADGLAAASLAGLAGWHAGCVTRDACVGTATDLPWAMTQPGSTVGRHPVELYTAALLAVGAIGIAVWKSRGRPPAGAPVAAGVLIVSVVRLLTEPLRPTLSGGPTSWYVAGAITGTASVAWLYCRRRQRLAAPTEASP
jgi:prolipoprotein diacylglyceryltransferase